MKYQKKAILFEVIMVVQDTMYLQDPKQTVPGIAT